MYNFVHLFGLWEEEGFILSKKLRGSCLKSALSVSWGAVGLKTVFVEELIVFLIISELWEKKLEFSVFFPAELWKLHFSCPGIILRRNNLPEKQSCSTFSESEQRKTRILAKKLRHDCQNSVLRVQKNSLTKKHLERIKILPIKLAFWAKKTVLQQFFMKPVFFLSRK